MKIENKYPQNVSNATNLEVEIFRNKYTNKVSYKNERGIITELENSGTTPTPTPTTTLGDSIWANGFRIVGSIAEDITLPANANIEFTGPLSISVGTTITVPLGTTLTIV